jgi:predicted TIM-barrel fold metal-dependent hydrolase
MQVDLLEKIRSLAGEKGDLVLRQDTPQRVVSQPMISVDDHLFEPPDVFVDRMPKALKDRAPRIERDGPVDWWIFEDERVPLLGADALKGWEPGRGYLGPVTFDEVHPAVWNIDERVRIMDVVGVLASLNFPSAPFGFAGQRFMRMKDPELGFASMQAFNDWVIEVWAGSHPERIIPCQVTWLADANVAAREVERNAARGFKAVSFSENPERLGLPSIYTSEWDQFFRACEETGTVINLHVGSSSETLIPSSESPAPVIGALFPVNGMSAAADWLYARIPMRFPKLKVAMSEAGIGWVPMLIDRIRHFEDRNPHYDAGFGDYSGVDLLRRTFWFATFSDPSSMHAVELVGADHVMVETDFPHTDSTWPETQALLGAQLSGVTKSVADQLAFRTAATLYRHPINEELINQWAA